MIEVARRVFYAPNTEEVPAWNDFGSYLARGFFFWFGLFIWALPFVLIMTISVLAAIIFGFAINEEALIGALIFLFYCAFFPVIFFFSIASMVVIPVLRGRYAIEGRFGALFEFKEIIADLRRIGPVPLLILVGTSMAASYAGQLGFILCFIGVIFTGFYSNVVIAHAAGQTYRLARGLQPPPTPAQTTTGY
jgi:hypothetical protein